MVGKGQKGKIKNRAKETEAGSLNTYIIGLIEAYMGKLSEE